MDKFSIEEIKNKIPKNLRPYIPFVIGGLAIGLIVYFRNRNEPQASDAYAYNTPEQSDGVGGDLGGVMSDMASQMQYALQQQAEQTKIALDASNQNMLDILASQNEYLNQSISSQKDYMNQLMLDQQVANQKQDAQWASLFQTMMERQSYELSGLKDSLSGYQSSSPKVYSRVANVQESYGNDDYSSSSGGSSRSIYFDDDVKDDLQYSNARKVADSIVKSGEASKSMMDKVLDQIAGYGNSGSGWQATGSAEEARKSRIDADRASEIDRTERVIKNRQEAGYDTSIQERYYDRLLKGGY